MEVCHGLEHADLVEDTFAWNRELACIQGMQEIGLAQVVSLWAVSYP